MPRLSLFKPERGQDFTFIDRQISEMFQVGGTDAYLHKYLGPKNPTTGTADQPVYDVVRETNIQDLLFLENRDRKYASEIYRVRGLYNVQNIDFNLSQFGLFIDNDTVYMTVHINDFVSYVGRKPLSGDVMELPHLVDQFQLSDADVSLPRYFVIEDVGRASEGFSATWYPHLYRLKLKKISANQQYADILTKPTGTAADRFVGEYVPNTVYFTGQIVRSNGILYEVVPGFETVPGTTLAVPNPTAWTAYQGNTLEAVLSTRAKELEINAAILNQAEADAPKSGYETRQFYTLAVDAATGKTLLNTADQISLDASQAAITTTENNKRPVRTGYTGYLVGDGFPSNGYDFGHGIQFPQQSATDDFFLRTDFLPNRLFRFDGARWSRVEDDVRMTMTNTTTRNTLKTGFINNDQFIYDQAVAIDHLQLNKGTYSFVTDIAFVSVLYVVLKLDTVELAYDLTEYPAVLTNVNGKVQITLPMVDSVQTAIPEKGVWRLSLCNGRQAQRQALSKALKPRADL